MVVLDGALAGPWEIRVLTWSPEHSSHLIWDASCLSDSFFPHLANETKMVMDMLGNFPKIIQQKHQAWCLKHRIPVSNSFLFPSESQVTHP